MELSFDDTVKIAVNSVSEGIMERSAAVSMILDASHNKCIGCSEKAWENFNNCMLTLERAVDEGIESTLDMDEDYPLDSIDCETAVWLYTTKGMLLNCEDGHVRGMYRDKLLKTNKAEVMCNGQASCV